MSDQSGSESEFEEPDVTLGGKRKRKVDNREASDKKKIQRASKNCFVKAPLSKDEVILSYNHGVAGLGRITAATSAGGSRRLPTSIGDAIRMEWGLPLLQQDRNPLMSSGDFTRDRQYQSDNIRLEWGLPCSPQARNPPASSGDYLFLKNQSCLLSSRELIDLEVALSSTDDSTQNGSGRRSPPKGDGSPRASGDVGYNLLNATPSSAAPKRSGPRPIVIDGSNIAFGHGRGKFSSRGLEICVSFFVRRNHRVVVFLPLFRRSHCQTQDPLILSKLESAGYLVYTPSRWVNSKLVVPYDDRYIVQVAVELGGVIVSKDNYRDIMQENPAWEKTIKERLLMPTWVGDILIFPLDPLGRNGPKLKEFLEY